MRVVNFGLLVLVHICLLGMSPLSAQTSDGYVGIYSDLAGTQPCATVAQQTAVTLYVIAKLSGVSTNGITGAEFRIEVADPQGWLFSFTPTSSDAIVFGTMLDLYPNNPDDGSGVNIAFGACQLPDANGSVLLGTLLALNLSGQPTHLNVKQHSTPSNPGYLCPLFTLCNTQLLKWCMSPSTEQPCSLSVEKSSDPVADQSVFVAGLNATTPSSGAEGLGATSVIAMFRSRDEFQYPAGQTHAIPQGMNIESSSVASVVGNYPVASVSKAFPAFSLADTITTTPDGRIVSLTDRSRIHVLSVPTIADAVQLAAALSSLTDRVLYAEVDGHIKYEGTCQYLPGETACPVTISCPDDDRFMEQWALFNAGQAGPGCNFDTQVWEAWEYLQSSGWSVGSSSVRIGILDSGVFAAHPDLMGRISGGDTNILGEHGTGVTGLVAAIANNNEGIAGVDWNAQILFKSTANNPVVLTGIASDLYDLIALGADVINMSFTIVDSNGAPLHSQTVRLALADAYRLNVVIVAAAGENEPLYAGQTKYPAGYADVIGVTSHDADGLPDVSASSGPHVSFAAPGRGVLSTSELDPSGYLNVFGTSFAAPQITGIVGLLYGYKFQNVTLHTDDVRHFFEITASNWPTRTDDMGYGRVNALEILKLVDDARWTVHFEQAAGGTDFSRIAEVTRFLVAPPGKPTGTFWAFTHEVRRSVQFPPLQGPAPPIVWGQGAATNGYNLEAINYAIGFCEPVEGTITNTGCVLRTYVYDLQTFWPSGQVIEAWYPSRPENVFFSYAVVDTNGANPTDVDSEGGPELLTVDFVNPAPTIVELKLTLPKAGYTKVEIFDVAGRRVRLVSDGWFPAGRTVVVWDRQGENSNPVTSGIYFALVTTPEASTSRRIVVVR